MRGHRPGKGTSSLPHRMTLFCHGAALPQACWSGDRPMKAMPLLRLVSFCSLAPLSTRLPHPQFRVQISVFPRAYGHVSVSDQWFNLPTAGTPIIHT